MTESVDREPVRHLAFIDAAQRERLGALRPRKQAVQERSRETVAAILEAAAQVFERQGFRAATTEAIAERAGVSIGSLYQYWPDKAALAVALMERHGNACLERLAPALQALADASVALEPRVHALVRALVDVHHERPDLHWTLDSDASVPAAFRARIGELTAKLSRSLVEAFGIDREAALVLACALDALPHALIRPATRLECDASVRELTCMLVAYLRARDAS